MPYIVHKKFSVPLNREEVSQSWSQRGYSCHLFVDPPGREWNDFVHSTNELVTVVEGKLRMTIDGEEIIAEPGDEVFIKICFWIPPSLLGGGKKQVREAG